MLAEAALYPSDSADNMPSVLTAEQTAAQIKANPPQSSGQNEAFCRQEEK